MKNLMSVTRIFTLGMAALLVPALALAGPTSLDFKSAKSFARGAAVLVKYKVTCDDLSEFADLNARLTQNAGGRRVADDFEFESIGDCGSTPQTVELIFSPDDDGGPYRKGSAFLRTMFFACDTGGINCSQINLNRSIRIR